VNPSHSDFPAKNSLSLSLCRARRFAPRFACFALLQLLTTEKKNAIVLARIERDGIRGVESAVAREVENFAFARVVCVESFS